MHYNLGAAWARAGDLVEAEASFSRALALDPRDDLTQAALGYCAEAKREWALALERYQRAVSLNSRNRYADEGRRRVLRQVASGASRNNGYNRDRGTSRGIPLPVLIDNVKYTNHLNVIVAIIGVIVIAQTLTRTFWNTAPEKKYSVEVPASGPKSRFKHPERLRRVRKGQAAQSACDRSGNQAPVLVATTGWAREPSAPAIAS